MLFVSLLKLLVLFLVAMGVWHLLQRVGAAGPARRPRAPGAFRNMFGQPPPFGGGFQQQPPPRPSPPPPQPNPASAPVSGEAVDLVKCRQCGAYIASVGARSCGRGDCPQPG